METTENRMFAGNESEVILNISFRGKKIEMPLMPTTNVEEVKSHILSSITGEIHNITALKLIHKGKVIKGLDGPGEFSNFLMQGLKKKKPPLSPGSKIVVRLMATGFSPTEARDVENSKVNAPRIRDDLSEAGKRDIEARQRLGRKVMLNANRKCGTKGVQKYGFGRIETLPMLPEQSKAKEILSSLVNDPGILACMAKHKWNVGCLAEMYPEGKVGQSEVCIMGLNQNKGAKILLRLRTDDLTGFRKILSIRKVLFHELAHNVHSEHNGDFFQLMRQIEKECNEMDWTQGDGLSAAMEDDNMNAYKGGTFRLGGEQMRRDDSQKTMSVRDLARRAALTRLGKEEEEICCGSINHSNKSNKLVVHNESKTTSDQLKDEDE